MVAYAPRHGEQEEMPYRSVRRRMALYRPTSSRAQGTRAPQASRLESDPRRPLLRAKERLPLAFAAQGLPAAEDRLRLVQEVALREGTWRRLNALSCVSSCAYVSAGAPSPPSLPDAPSTGVRPPGRRPRRAKCTAGSGLCSDGYTVVLAASRARPSGWCISFPRLPTPETNSRSDHSPSFGISLHRVCSGSEDIEVHSLGLGGRGHAELF